MTPSCRMPGGTDDEVPADPAAFCGFLQPVYERRRLRLFGVWKRNVVCGSSSLLFAPANATKSAGKIPKRPARNCYRRIVGFQFGTKMEIVS